MQSFALLRGAFAFETVRRALLRCGERRDLSARRAFLRRHRFKTTLAADLAAFASELAHDLGKQRFLLPVHTTILSGFRRE
jgi:hypothetical protein